MRLSVRIIAVALSFISIHFQSYGQGLHFSQFYNAPMLLNPANTALVSDNDFRLGINYRQQWASIPVPYTTMSAFADFQAFRQEELSTNWLGIGFAVFTDKAGDGLLSLTDMRMSLAYHIQLNDISMISAGIYGGNIQRSVDFNKLRFDLQWDGYKFNPDLNTGERLNIIKTSYIDAGVGINYAYFPNEAIYIKIGVGAAHVNSPNETFYGIENKLGIRPMGNADGIFVINETFTFNPSAYYSFQRGAYELLYGTQLLFALTDNDKNPCELILGGYHRWNEAVVGVMGIRYSGMKAVFSYDYTISKLSPHNNNNGAIEFSLIYLGNYGKGSRNYRSANCPRF